jgi:hypothetical protein
MDRLMQTLRFLALFAGLLFFATSEAADSFLTLITTCQRP